MSWKNIRLGDYVKIKTGKLDANASSEDGLYPFFTCSKDPLKIDTFSYDCECVLVAGNGDLNAKYYEGKFDAYQRTYIIESIDKEKLNVKYLYYFLSEYLTYLREQSIGGVIKYIKLENLTDAKLPLPAITTQKRIAEILDAADALRRKDQELLSKYDELAQSIFIDMFGDPVKNEKGWEEHKIKDVAAKGKHSMKAGPFGSSLKKEFYKPTGYKIYGQEQVIADDFSIGDYYISEDKFTELQNCSIHSGDVLISLVGTYGKISVVPEVFEKGIINPRLMKITLNRSLFNPYFFKFLLQTEQMYNRIGTFSRGGTMDIVNVGIISEVIVIVPPLDLQYKFMGMLFSINAQKKVLQKKISENLFDSLLQQAFKGELVK